MNGSATVRKNLVAVRAGKSSLHPMWLQGPAERHWDMIVSVYDPDARFEPRDDVQIIVQPGGKWDGLYALFAGSDLLSRYEYIWLPDDDIAASSEDINALFAAMQKYGLDVAQPSLTRDSYFTHFACMQCPGFTLRYTNYVETMVPCLRAALLTKVLDDFRDTMSGWGLDPVWCRLSDDPRYKAAILDSVAVRHTRPLGKVLRGKMAEHGRSPEAEQEALRARYGVGKRVRPLQYAALDARGRRIEGCTRLGWMMARRHLSVLEEFHNKNVALEKIWQVIRRHTGRKPDLTPLRRAAAR